MIASIAPSEAPAETPSVNGVASGLRSSAWKTTPAAASAAPTSAPASTRGSRATKKICASTLSANGIDRSNTRARLMCVLPTSGASRQVDDRQRAEAGERQRQARADRPCGDRRSGATRRPAERRRDGRLIAVRTGTTVRWPAPFVKAHVGVDVVQLLDRRGRQHLARRPLRQHAPVAQQHERVAQRRRQIQVVRRQHHRHAALAIEPLEQRRDLELVAEIERRRRLVEQQHVGRLRQRAGDDDALLLAAAERHVRAVGEMGGAGRRQRVARDREVVRTFELKRAEVRMPPHQHHLHAR